VDPVWSSTAAFGTGVEEANDCNPYCAAGTFIPWPVTVSLNGPRTDGLGTQFTRAIIDRQWDGDPDDYGDLPDRAADWDLVTYTGSDS